MGITETVEIIETDLGALRNGDTLWKKARQVPWVKKSPKTMHKI